LILTFNFQKIEIKVYTANIKIRFDLHRALQLDEFYIKMIFIGVIEMICNNKLNICG